MRILIYIFIFALYLPSLKAENSSNAEALLKANGPLMSSLYGKLSEYEIDTLTLDLGGMPSDFLLEKSLMSISKNIAFTKNSSDQIAKLSLRTINYSIAYSLIGKDSVERIASCDLTAILTMPSGNVINIDLEKSAISEYMRWEMAQEANNAAQSFAKGTLPERPISFYTKVLEPVIIVASAILTVALFFSIRSK